MAIVYGTDLESRQEQMVSQRKQRLTAMVASLKTAVEAEMEYMLTDDTMTSQQKYDAWGTDAGNIVAAGTQLINTILHFDVSYDAPVPADFNKVRVVNQDGTVTVSAL